MTLPPPPQGSTAGRRRVRSGSVLVGVAVALIADLVTIGGLPTLASAWHGPVPAPVPASPSLPPVVPSSSAGPSTSSPTQTSPAASGSPTSGAVKIDSSLSDGIVLVAATLDATTSSAGTGMILTSSGQVLTNYHVVRSSSEITVTVCSDKKKYKATVIGRNARKDVALLQLEGASGLTTIKTDADAVAQGDPVVVAGNAAGQGFLTAFAGKIVSKGQNIRVRGAAPSDPIEDLTGLIETDAHAQPGDSGGPVFDAQREVLGMTTAGSSDAGNNKTTAFAVPIADALGVVAKIRDGLEGDGVVVGPKAAIGINASNDSLHGVKVSNVVAGTAASRAGLKAGDYLKSIDGRTLATLSDLMKALDDFQPGQTVKLTWRTSGGVDKSASVALDASKYN